MRRRLIARVGLVVRVLSAFAFAFLCFASTSQSFGDQRELSASEVAAYLLPDGSLPSLCVTIPGSSGQGKIVKLASDTLGLCKVVAFSLPAAPVITAHAAGKGSPVSGQDHPLRHLLYPPGSGPRAPPTSV